MTYPQIAARAAEYLLKHQEPTPVPVLTPQLRQQRACYVSIFRRPGRRFCNRAGGPLPRHATLAEEIIANTIQAIMTNQSSRLSRSDLPTLTFSVAVLGPLQRISSTSHLAPETHGLYALSDRGKSTIILPQRVGIETPDDQVATAIREANIDTRQEAVTLYRFPVEYYED